MRMDLGMHLINAFANRWSTILCITLKGLECMRRRKLGDVYSLKLPNEEYVFLHLYQGTALGIYKQRGRSIEDMPSEEEIGFFVYVYDYVFKSFEFVKNVPFENEDSSWPPPFCWVDQISGKGYLWNRGQRIACTYEECKDLEILAVW